jgi:LDH2 family malate/lactate/ureidoglycolate dehydrogenase
MLHGSRLGIDSHGVRLLDHYVMAIRGGRVDARPALRFIRRTAATALLDAGNAHGARAAYAAMEEAVRLARAAGIGAVSIRRTSHFGPAGAYALAASEAACIGLAFCNSDSFVRLHDGAVKFHGTNPIAMAVPLSGNPPWLLDMATSAITYNRLQLQRALGEPLPADVASTGSGQETREPELAEMLAPLGGAFGFKGAGLAGLVEILCAVLGGTRTSAEILPMSGPDFSTPRDLGAFVLAIDPDAFIERTRFESGLRRYLDALRASSARPGAQVLAPGDREWNEARRRETEGIPIDPATADAFRRLAEHHGLALPFRTRQGP